MSAGTLRLMIVSAMIAAAIWGGRKVFENLKGEKYRPLFDEAETLNNIPHGLLFRQAYQESRFRDDIIDGAVQSPAGALGIMQIIPRWHPALGASGALDPERAIPYAAQYMAQLFHQFGSWERALAAYNWGPGNISNTPSPAGWPKETRDYVTQILTDIPVMG